VTLKNYHPIPSLRSAQPTHREVDYPEGMIYVTKTDIRGVVTYTNDSFVEISGFSREELIGENHNIVRHPDMPRWVFSDLWSTIKSGHPWRGIVKNRTKNGDYYWVRATVSPIVVDNNVVGYMSLRRKPTQ
jgi:aerotaxis receptor